MTDTQPPSTTNHIKPNTIHPYTLKISPKLYRYEKLNELSQRNEQYKTNKQNKIDLPLQSNIQHDTHELQWKRTIQCIQNRKESYFKCMNQFDAFELCMNPFAVLNGL